MDAALDELWKDEPGLAAELAAALRGFEELEARTKHPFKAARRSLLSVDLLPFALLGMTVLGLLAVVGGILSH